MHFAAIFSFLGTISAPLVKRVLVALGIGMVTFAGFQLSVNAAKSYVQSNFSGLPSDVVHILGLLKFDVAINIVFAAVITRAVIAGMDKVTGGISKLGPVK